MEPANNITLPVNDIITPEAIASWPPAIGWWLLSCLVVLLFVAGIIYFKRYQQHWAYRRAALKELKILIEQSDSSNMSVSTAALLTIIKRVSMTIYDDKNFAMLEGSRFLDFANSIMSKTVFSQKTINNIDRILYKGTQDFDIHSFYHECCHWVKHHPKQHQQDTTTQQHGE